MSQARLDEIAETFHMVDPETRVELLLDYAKQLPPLPDRLCEQRNKGLNRVPECMTPVFLWVEVEEGADNDQKEAPSGGNGDVPNLRLYIDVAEEAPTVRGLLSIIVQAYDHDPATDLAQVPNDLLSRLGLQDLIRMNRVVGLNAILGRIRRAGEQHLKVG